MKTKLFLLLGVFALITGCQNDDDGSDIAKPRKDIVLSRAEEVLTNENIDFAFRLFKQVNNAEKEHANWAISPLSTSLALGMVANGAAGNTLEEIKGVLGFSSFELEAMNTYNQKLVKELLDLDNTTLLNIANSIWVKNTYPIDNSFVDLNKSMYDARVESLDLSTQESVKIINDWVSSQTNKAIKEVVSAPNSYVNMYLMNALYFKGIWRYPFKKSNTKEELFTNADGSSVEVPMMNLEESFIHIQTDDFNIAEFPYGNSAFSMVILLPAEGKTLDESLVNLTYENWSELYDDTRFEKLIVKLPRFELNSNKDLADDLKSMGIKDAFFEETADFSKLTPSPDFSMGVVDQVINIKVNEEGTEASTVTNIHKWPTSNSSRRFHVDRPFAFMIKEKSTGTILFMGKVTKM